MDGTTARKAFLKEVEDCVCRARNESYDDAENNFERIAAIANVMFGKKLIDPLTPVDVALFSMCIKMGRLAFDSEHSDSWVDTAGYAACGAGILMQEKSRQENTDQG